MSDEGRHLVNDLREVIDSAKWLLLKKNYHEQLQNFLNYTIEASTVNGSTNVNVPVSREKAQEHGTEALQNLSTLGRLIITNGQFRKLLSDATILFRDMAADGAAKATQRLRPGQDRLETLDEPAPDHTWHEGPPSAREIKDSIRNKLRLASDQTAQEAKGVSQDVSQAARTQRDAQDENFNRDVDESSAARTGWQSVRDRASGKIPDSHKDTARQWKTDATDYLKEKIHPERREKTIHRLKKMIIEIQLHEDYVEAIDSLLSLAEEYARHTQSVARDARNDVKRTVTTGSLEKARQELKSLLENFADYTSMDDIFYAIDDLVNDANNDEEFSNWWKAVYDFIRRCLKEKEYILRDESTNQYNLLRDQGQYFLNERYKVHTDRLLDEINQWFNYMKNDPDNVDFGEKVQKLFTDLGQGPNGNIVFKKHLLADVTDVIVPGIFTHARYIPVRFHALLTDQIDPENRSLWSESWCCLRESRPRIREFVP